MSQPRDLQLTEAGQEALELARAESEDFCHEYVGTEHLLLALSRQTQGSAVTVLRKSGVDYSRLRETIVAVVKPGSAPPQHRSQSYTSRANRVFALAKESALASGLTEVGPEHLLIGLVQEAKGIGAQILKQYGLSADVVVSDIRRFNSTGHLS